MLAGCGVIELKTLASFPKVVPPPICVAVEGLEPLGKGFVVEVLSGELVVVLGELVVAFGDDGVETEAVEGDGGCVGGTQQDGSLLVEFGDGFVGVTLHVVVEVDAEGVVVFRPE